MARRPTRRTQRELDEQNETASDGRASAYLKQKRIAEELLETERKINEETEASDALLEEILKREKRLNELREEGRELSEEARDLQRERDELEKEWEDRYESLNQKQERFNELTTETVDLESKLIAYGKQQQKQISDIGDQRSKSLYLAEQAQSKLTGASKTWQDSQGITRDLMFEQSAIAVKTQQILENQGSLSERYIDSLEDGLSMADSLANIQKDITSSVEKASTGEYQKLDLSKQREEVENRTAELAYIRKQMDEGSIDMSEDEYQILLQQLKSHGEYLTSLEKQNEVLAKASEQAKKVLGVFDSILELDIKGALRQGFNLDKIQSGIKKQIGATFANIAAEMKGEKGLVGGLKAAGSGMKALLGMAPMFMKALAIGGLIAIVGFLIDSFGKVDEEVAQLGKDMGISKHEAMELHHAAVDTAAEMKLVGINSKEVAEGLKLSTEIMGGFDLASRFAAGDEKVKQLVKDTTILSKEFGLGADEIKNIQNLATMSGKSMGQLTAEATTLNKGLMSGKESLKMLAAIPPKVAVAFKGGTQELIKAAAKAKMLGMNLQEVQDIGMGMLDIESSLEKEMEARVLTGKDLNLDAARYYALQGDTASLQDELLKQAGSLKDFQAMGPIQQKAMADAMGMSVEKMTELLTNAEKLKELGIDDAKMKDLQAMNAEQLNAELAKGGSQQYQDYVRNLAKEKESAAVKEKFADAVTKLQEKLSKLVTPLINLADMFLGLLDIVGGFEPILYTISALIGLIAVFWVGKKLAGGFKLVKDGISSMKDGLSGFFNMIKGPGSKAMDTLGDGASKAVDATKDKAMEAADKLKENTGKMKTPKGGKKAGGFLKSLVDSIKRISYADIIKVAAAIVILSAAIGIAAIAFKLFGDVDWNSVAKGLVTLAVMVGAVMLLGNAAPNIILGAAAVVILSASLLIAAKAMQQFSTGVSWDGVLMGITTLGALTLAVLALGSLMMSGVGAVAIIAGAGALLILSVALMAMGVAMQLFAKAAVTIMPFLEGIGKYDVGKIAALAGAMTLLGLSFAALGLMIIPIMLGAAALTILSGSLMVFGLAATLAAKGMEGITKNIGTLLSFDPSRFESVAKGLDTIGSAVMRMGAGSLMAGVGEGISKIFGGESPLDKVMNITEKLNPEKLSSTAKAIKDLADSFKYFAEETGKLKEFDTDKLDSIIERMEKVREAESGGGLSNAVSGVANAVTGFIGNLFGTPEQQTAQPVTAGASAGGGGIQSGGGGGDKLDKVISLLSQIASSANQPTVIKFGDKTVEEIKSQLNFKSAYDVKVDNTYGRT
jgi:hypothetical protein